MGKSPNVTIRVPERTPSDWSHKWYGTVGCGTLVPLFVNEVIPNTKIKCKMAIGVELPPLASDTLMNVSYKVEAFFVPLRICCQSFEDWYIQGDQSVLYGDLDTATDAVTNIIDTRTPVLPRFTFSHNDQLLIYNEYDPTSPLKWNAPGTLADYLGVKGNLNSTTDQSFSCLPFIAYHMIYNYWYRRSDIQAPVFINHGYGINANNYLTVPVFQGTHFAACLPYYYFTNGPQSSSGDFNLTVSNTNANAMLLGDNTSIFELRQRNFGFDYFTNAFATASNANMEVNVSSNKFSISSLRQANSLQQFADLNQLPGKVYQSVLKARSNANLSDGVAQRPVFLGSASYEVYSRGVSVNAGNSGAGIPSGNPMADFAGGRVGNAFASGSDFIINGFVANEPGYIFIIGSLVPRVNYSSGIRRYLRRYITGSQADITDMPNHMLQNVGNQPIFVSELVSTANHGTAVFGYTDRYAEQMHMESEVHGLFQAGENLASFVSQRNLTSSAGIGSGFLRIPYHYLDDVMQVSAANAQFGAMVSVDFDCKVTQPLYEYSLPSLQNPAYEHGNPVTIHRGGFRF